jgi:hypothetical protein
MRGPFKNPGITWNRIEKFAQAWEIAQIWARNPLLYFNKTDFTTVLEICLNNSGSDSRQAKGDGTEPTG